MLDEILYMETRLLREFCERFQMDHQKTNHLFKQHNIWHYIESCYDYFHTCGDDYILDDITSVLRAKGVVL